MAGEQARDAGLGDRFMTEIGEAARLPVADGTVDGAMCSFVLQLLPNRSAGVREAFRVLRPGSPFAALTWRADEDPWEVEDASTTRSTRCASSLRCGPTARAARTRHPRWRPQGCAVPASGRSRPARVAGASLHAGVLPRCGRALDRGGCLRHRRGADAGTPPCRGGPRPRASSGRPRLAASARQRRRDPSGLRGLLAFAPQANRTTKRPIRDPPSHSSPAAAIGRSICAPAPVFVTVTCSPAQTRA